MPTAPAMSTPSASDAQGQLDQITQYIKDKKYDMADAALKQLEANKASLPASIQPQVDTLRQTLTAAQAGNGMTMPTVPAIPGSTH
jgi:hypothetical protein